MARAGSCFGPPSAPAVEAAPNALAVRLPGVRWTTRSRYLWTAQEIRLGATDRCCMTVGTHDPGHRIESRLGRPWRTVLGPATRDVAPPPRPDEAVPPLARPGGSGSTWRSTPSTAVPRRDVVLKLRSAILFLHGAIHMSHVTAVRRPRPADRPAVLARDPMGPVAAVHDLHRDRPGRHRGATRGLRYRGGQRPWAAPAELGRQGSRRRHHRLALLVLFFHPSARSRHRHRRCPLAALRMSGWSPQALGS